MSVFDEMSPTGAPPEPGSEASATDFDLRTPGEDWEPSGEAVGDRF